jgi:hypothetical protein
MGTGAPIGDCLMTQTLVAGIFLLVTAMAAAGAAVALGPTEKRAIVRDLLKTPETRDPAPIRFVKDAKYIQHNANVEDGKTGLMSLIARLPKDTKIETVRLLADGRLLKWYKPVAAIKQPGDVACSHVPLSSQRSR